MRTVHSLRSLTFSTLLVVPLACSTLADDYANRAGNGGGGGGVGGTTTSSGGGGGADGGGGQGGAVPCDGACQDPTPLCDEANDTCVACLEPGDCTDPTAARCEAGACNPCQGADDCGHLAGLSVCDNGSCVACSLGNETACMGQETCDLFAKTCTGPAAATVQNCRACTNDLQCQSGHRCISMDFEGTHHGYYCLKEYPPNCAQPFSVLVSRVSLSGASAADYCGIEEDLATCEVVLALVANWRCSGTDGMCSPDGIQPEQAVPGALCQPVGGLGDRCTYACAGAAECLSAGPSSTCGLGNPPQSPPSWCGG